MDKQLQRQLFEMNERGVFLTEMDIQEKVHRLQDTWNFSVLPGQRSHLRLLGNSEIVYMKFDFVFFSNTQ